MAVPAVTDKRFRRSHVSPARKRRRFEISRKRVAYLALGALVLYAVYRGADAMVAAGALTVARITVSGNTRLSDEEVVSLLEGLQGRNILLVSLEQWRQTLLMSPWVEDAAVRRVLPRTVDVLIAERQPVGIGRVGHTLYLIDQHGAIIDEFGPTHAEFDLPVIDGLAASDTARNTEPGTGDTPVVDAARALLAIRLLASLEGRPDLAGRVSQIDVTDPRDAVVILKGDTAQIRVGEGQFAERLQSYLDLLPTLRQKVPQIDYVDLRFGERVYVRPLGPGSKAQKTGGG